MKEESIRPTNLLQEYLELCQNDLGTLLPDHSKFQRVKCPGCGSLEGRIAFFKWGHSYEECTQCSSFYMNPRPTQAALSIYYSEGKASEFWAKEYYSRTIVARREPVYRRRAEWLKTVSIEYKLSMNSILDVGCGVGIFLEELIRCFPNANVSGLEPGAKFAEEARKTGASIFENWLEDPIVPDRAGRYDCITLFEVWEHLHTIPQSLHRIRNLLNPGGVIFFTTLCRDGFDIEVLKGEHKNIYPPCHINILSHSGFRHALGKENFEILEQITPGKLDVEIVRKALAENPAKDVFLEKLLRNSSEIFLREFQELLSKNGLSSHCWILARKNVSE